MIISSRVDLIFWQPKWAVWSKDRCISASSLFPKKYLVRSPLKAFAILLNPFHLGESWNPVSTPCLVNDGISSHPSFLASALASHICSIRVAIWPKVNLHMGFQAHIYAVFSLSPSAPVAAQPLRLLSPQEDYFLPGFSSSLFIGRFSLGKRDFLFLLFKLFLSFILVSHLGVLMVYFWLWAQGSLLVVPGDHIWYKKSNQASYL